MEQLDCTRNAADIMDTAFGKSSGAAFAMAVVVSTLCPTDLIKPSILLATLTAPPNTVKSSLPGLPILP